MKTQFVITLFLKSILISVVGGVMITACQKSGEKDLKPEFKDYAEIKTDDWKSKIGQAITIEGYLIMVAENTYKIVNDSIYAQANMVLADQNYMLVQTNAGNGTFNPFSKLPDLNGMKVKATGTLSQYQPRDVAGESLNYSAKLLGDKHLATVSLNEMPEILSDKKFEIASVSLNSMLNVTAMRGLPQNRTKFAFLYSGGVDAMQAASWYYNNIQTMYNVLVKQGYPKENIVVVYKNGSPERAIPSTLFTSSPKEYPEVRIDYAATPDGLDAAIDHLNKIMRGNKAELFVMTTNHGGGFLNEKRGKFERGNYSGQPDSDRDEPTNSGTEYDEVLTYYNVDRFITDDEFAQKINSLPFVALKALFLQCFSGGFLHDLRGPNRVLISAASENEVSWGGGSRDLDMFLVSFLNPIVLGANPIHDLNNDGQLQMNEIFLGAQLAQDIHGGLLPIYKMTPQYDDDGDGKPNRPSATGLGSKLTL